MFGHFAYPVYLLVPSRFLRWLAKAEGLHIDVDEVDWNLLAGMGTGAVGGVRDSGISNYQDAVAACSVLSEIYRSLWREVWLG